MKRRDLLKAAATLPLLASTMANSLAATTQGTKRFYSRVRPADPDWPSANLWVNLREQLGGRLLKLDPPFASCVAAHGSAACIEAMRHLGNTFEIGDQPGLTQTSGWVDAWTSQPSAYAVAAESTADVVAAVNFARQHRLRLTIKGGGHSYQGTSSAPDSLLIWTRHMNEVSLHDSFVPQGCAAKISPQPAVTLGAGAMWIDAYDAVSTQGGRYVQGGGCTTVGVAGLIQSGGFGNFSKKYGTAAAGLLEAQVVTADGVVRIANACTNPELFWALKGGGGGGFGVVTRLTLRTRDLPDTFGAVFLSVKATSDEAYRDLLAKLLEFYRDALLNPGWGEQIGFHPGNRISVSMVFQGMPESLARQTWQPFLDWLSAHASYVIDKPFECIALPAQHFWDATFMKRYAPDFIVADTRNDAPPHHVLWKGDLEQAGWFIHGYRSAWLPASLLMPDQLAKLADAIFRSTRHWSIGFHFNKGLAGSPAAEIEAARDTATNPAVLDAFALAIIAGGSGPQFPGMLGKPVDSASAREQARAIALAMEELLKVVPNAGSYVSESDYFLKQWQSAFWGEHHPRLARIKRQYDPEGLFFTRHGIGSEGWSEDGFTPLQDAKNV